MNARLELPQPVFRSTGTAEETFNVGPIAPKLEKVCRLCRKNRRGAAVVEFAIVAPVFFLFVFGMIEYGRMVMVQQILTNASREGARFAVVQSTDDTTAVQDTVIDYLTSASIGGTPSVVVDWPPSGGSSSSEPVTVTVSIQFGQVSWLPSPMFVDSTMPLTAVSVMRRESTN
ncbi:MAG: TadE/TadG family type IV pilus assembly protein [Pirellulales bacterium]